MLVLDFITGGSDTDESIKKSEILLILVNH